MSTFKPLIIDHRPCTEREAVRATRGHRDRRRKKRRRRWGGGRRRYGEGWEPKHFASFIILIGVWDATLFRLIVWFLFAAVKQSDLLRKRQKQQVLSFLCLVFFCPT